MSERKIRRRIHVESEKSLQQRMDAERWCLNPLRAARVFGPPAQRKPRPAEKPTTTNGEQP